MHIQKKAIRSHIIKIRVNHDEMTSIKMRAGASATAEWLRDLAMGFPMDLTQRPSRHHARIAYACDPDRSEMVREVARIGSNLNQLTRAVNGSRFTGSTINLLMVATQLSAVWEELSNVQQSFQARQRPSYGDRLPAVANGCAEANTNTSSSTGARRSRADQGDYP